MIKLDTIRKKRMGVWTGKPEEGWGGNEPYWVGLDSYEGKRVLQYCGGSYVEYTESVSGWVGKSPAAFDQIFGTADHDKLEERRWFVDQAMGGRNKKTRDWSPPKMAQIDLLHESSFVVGLSNWGVTRNLKYNDKTGQWAKKRWTDESGQGQTP